MHAVPIERPGSKADFVARINYEPAPMLQPKDMQLANEYTYSRKHLDKYLRYEIEAR